MNLHFLKTLSFIMWFQILNSWKAKFNQKQTVNSYQIITTGTDEVSVGFKPFSSIWDLVCDAGKHYVFVQWEKHMANLQICSMGNLVPGVYKYFWQVAISSTESESTGPSIHRNWNNFALSTNCLTSNIEIPALPKPIFEWAQRTTKSKKTGSLPEMHEHLHFWGEHWWNESCQCLHRVKIEISLTSNEDFDTTWPFIFPTRPGSACRKGCNDVMAMVT